MDRIATFNFKADIAALQSALTSSEARPQFDEPMQALVGRIRNCQIDATIMLDLTPFKVVGVFQSKGAFQSEIWGDADRMLEALNRRSFSRLIAVLKDPGQMDEFASRLKAHKQVPAKVLTEREYLTSQTQALSSVLKTLGFFLAFIMGVAAVFTPKDVDMNGIMTQMVGIIRQSNNLSSL